MPLRIPLVLSVVLATLLACQGGEMDGHRVALPSIEEVPAEAWDKLAQKKIYFGHMSVGFNIMAGIEDILKENSKFRLSIVETSNPADFNRPLFAHSRLGKNHKPLSKIEGFSAFMEKGLGEKANVAFFKFCFVDIYAATDVQNLFGEYKAAMAELRKKYPQVAFVHVTTPLTVVQSGIKAFVKEVIGRPIDGYEENIQREAFNELLRREYDGREPVFDLAMFESALPDGRRNLFTKKGKAYPFLVPEYTNDGGHLNQRGRQIAAEQLLIFLALLCR